MARRLPARRGTPATASSLNAMRTARNTYGWVEIANHASAPDLLSLIGKHILTSTPQIRAKLNVTRAMLAVSN